MTHFLGGRTLSASLAIAVLACGVAGAQYAADFEPPTFMGSPDGVVITGQDAFYIPPDTVSVDFLVYTYADNALGLVDNPGGGDDQFVAGTGPADSTYARAQRDTTWPASGIQVVIYDVAALWLPENPGDLAGNNVGSFSVQPYPGTPVAETYIHLFSWLPGAEGSLWRAFYMMYDAGGVADPQPGRQPGPEWDNLVLNHWYRFSTTIDFDINQVIEVSMTDLATGQSATVDTSGLEWYLGGGAAGGEIPTGFRLFAGGSEPGNTVAFDNLYMGNPPQPCPGDLDGDGDTDLSDLSILLASYGVNAGGDLDGDGDTDLADLAILLSDYGCTP